MTPTAPDQIDQLKRDRADLTRYIKLARQALADLAPTSLRGERLSQARLQIAAALASTEEAAETIMREAEAGLSVRDDESAEAYRDRVGGHFIQIIEACAFQDLNGQRISKVLVTLQTIEDRLSRLEAALGERFGQEGEPGKDLASMDDLFLQGPALPGSGITQNDVDQILAGR